MTRFRASGSPALGAVPGISAFGWVFGFPALTVFFELTMFTQSCRVAVSAEQKRLVFRRKRVWIVALVVHLRFSGPRCFGSSAVLLVQSLGE